MTVILGIDPGARRGGWALTQEVDGQHYYLASGVSSLPREDGEPFQKYRLRLVEHWADTFSDLVDQMDDLRHDLSDPDYKILFEIVPAIGFQSGGAVQSQLAQVVVTVCQALCEEWFVNYEQLSATTIKQRATGYGNATKVQVRNAVLSVFPELEPRKKELTSTADESDAIAISIVGGGYQVPKAKANPRRKKSKS